MAKIGTVIDGKYEILKQIGKGGMSTVYLAMDKRLNKQWAVKEISRKGVGKNNEEIVNEVPPDAEMMKKLDHPAIPTIVDIIDDKTSPYIYVVMDYVEGESLDKVLAEYGAQPQELVIDWAKQICEALGYLHSQKPPIIYRDMKPANVMLKPEGNIKIIDFGIAREYKEGNLADTTVLGTKGYASPEHYGGRQTDERSDIYTLGMTMHHLVTGVDPRPADYIYAPIRQWNPELSGGLERIIDKCVSPDPKNRYQNCNELLYALDHYTEEEDSFKRKQKRKLFTFTISIILAIVFGISAVTSYSMQNKYESENYSSLILYNDQNYEKNIKAAVDIDQESPKAYDEYLSFIVSDGKITDTEFSAFKTQYRRYIEKVLKGEIEISGDVATKNDYSRIAFLSGVYTMIYYEAEDSKNKAEAADDYFEVLASGNFTETDISKCFYAICKMYKESSFTPEGENDGFNITSYSDLFEQMDTLLDIIDNCDTGKSGNDAIYRTAFYKATMELMNSQMKQIYENSIPERDVAELLDKLCERLEEYKNSSNKDAKNNATSALELGPKINDRLSQYYGNNIRSN